MFTKEKLNIIRMMLQYYGVDLNSDINYGVAYVTNMILNALQYSDGAYFQLITQYKH